MKAPPPPEPRVLRAHEAGVQALVFLGPDRLVSGYVYAYIYA
jgi:hypothetical protein